MPSAAACAGDLGSIEQPSYFAIAPYPRRDQVIDVRHHFGDTLRRILHHRRNPERRDLPDLGIAELVPGGLAACQRRFGAFRDVDVIGINRPHNPSINLCRCYGVAGAITEASCLELGQDLFHRPAVVPQQAGGLDHGLLVFVRLQAREPGLPDDAKAVGRGAARKQPAGPQRCFRLKASLADPVSIEIGERRHAGEQQFAGARSVRGGNRIGAEIEEHQVDTDFAEGPRLHQGIGRVAEHSIEFSADDAVTRLQGGEQLLTLWAAAESDRA